MSSDALARRRRACPQNECFLEKGGASRNSVGSQNVSQNKEFTLQDGVFTEMYAAELKRVIASIGDEGDKEGRYHENEGMPQNVYENNRDTNMIRIKFIGRPECI
jgi:hypothetical protein